MTLLNRLIAGALLLAALAGTAAADPAEDRQAYRDSLATQLGACSAAATQIGSTPASLLSAFAGLTAGGAPCRWKANATPDGVNAAQLIAAALDLITEESAGCELRDGGWECGVAATLKRRGAELLAYAANSDAPLLLERYDFSARSKIFGAQEEAIDPVWLMLKAGPSALTDNWPSNRAGISITGTPEMPGLREALAGAGAPLGDDCPACAVRARKMLLYVVFFDAIYTASTPISAERWAPIQALAAKYSARWEAYHFGGGSARTPLPWELWANGLIYQRLNADRAKREGDLPNTPGVPPKWSLTLMHPSVGIVPFDSKGAESNVVGVVEALGISHWTYDSVTNARKDEWGISVAAVYQPREDADDWSAGLLLRLPFQGVNVVYSRPELASGAHDEVWALSVDPGKLFGEGGMGDFSCMFGLPMCKK